MKSIISTIKKTVKNIIYLSSIQFKIGIKGVIYQFSYSILNSSKSFLLILLPKFLIDACTGFHDANYFLTILFVFSFVTWIVDIFIGITEVLQSIYNLKFAHFFKRKIAKKAMSMDYKDMESSKTLDKIERALDSAYDLSGSQITDFFSYILKLAILIYIVSTLEWYIAVLTLFVVIIIYLLNKKVSQKNHYYDMLKSPIKRHKKYVEESMLNFNFSKDLRIFNCQNFLLEKHKKTMNSLIEIQKKQERVNLFFSVLTNVINTLFNSAIYVFLIIKYSLGLTAISSFTMYLSTVSEFYGAIDAVFFMFVDFYKTNINIKEVEEFLELKESLHLNEEEDLRINKIKDIEFRNVSFTYPGQTVPALNDVSFKIKSNQKVMLVGENGAGKSTIAKLLMRLYKVDSGEILLNGINVDTIPYSSYISFIEPVFQEVNILAYTLKENICFCDRLNDNDEWLNQVILQSGLSERIESLPQKINTFYSKSFDEYGVNLSGGEKQKLSISRAIYKKGDILILDEPNSALDPISEKELFLNINKLGSEKITIFISHRLSASKFCDMIYVFKDGRVVEEGGVGDLIKKKGLFYDMFKKQAEFYN